MTANREAWLIHAATANREAWLIHAAEAMAPWLQEAGHQVPPIRVSVGPLRTRRNGECWPTKAAKDKVSQIFVTATRGEENSVGVLATLLHEMIHAVDDCKSGHGKGFSAIAKTVGFKPKWTSSDNRTDELTERLAGLVERLGPFPHAAILAGRAADAPKKQTARMLKVTCVAEGSEYKVRMSRKMIDDVGTPICPCHEMPMELSL